MELASSYGIDPKRLAISSWCWGSDYYAGQFTLLDFPQKAAELGYQQLEMNDFMLPVPRFSRVVQPLYRAIGLGETDVWRYRRSTLYELKQRLDAQNQSCLCWTLNTDFSVQRRFDIIYWRWGADAAKCLQADCLRIILGGSADHPISVGEAAKNLTRGVTYLLSHLPVHTTVLLENHWGMGSAIGRFLAIYTAACSKLSIQERSRFKLCLDPANMSDEDQPAQWEKMIPHAQQVHLKSAYSQGEPMDLGLLLEMLEHESYTGLFTVEDL